MTDWRVFKYGIYFLLDLFMIGSRCLYVLYIYFLFLLQENTFIFLFLLQEERMSVDRASQSRDQSARSSRDRDRSDRSDSKRDDRGEAKGRSRSKDSKRRSRSRYFFIHSLMVNIFVLPICDLGHNIKW